MNKCECKLICTCNNLNIRTGPSTSYSATGLFLNKNDVVDVIEEKDGWYKIDENKWVYSNNNTYLKTVNNNKIASTRDVTKDEAEATEDESTSIFDALFGEKNGPDLADYGGLTTSLTSQMTFKELDGLFGIPYQYTESVDRRLQSGTFTKMFYGRKFSDKIMTKLPLLVMTPGKPEFMSGFSSSYKEGMAAKISELLTNKESVSLDELLNGEASGKYYTFAFDYANYYKIVNPMCKQMANFMGVEDFVFKGTKLGNFNWDNYTNDQMKGLISGNEYISFYIESETQISESFSSSTGESMLSSGLNQMSDIGKEISFLLGYGAGVKLEASSVDGYEATTEMLGQLVGNSGYSPAHILERLKSGISTIASGGKLIFPEIWKDSTYSKSYSVNIKLISPDSDNVSIFLNIMVPMLHLMAFSLPIQIGYNGLASPFLVRAFYKGFFNCDMGIVTDMTINKGAEGRWNINGIPTQVDISLTIKDLYQALALSSPSCINPAEFLRNSSMIDFLANMAGVNINKPELLRSLGMYIDVLSDNITSLPNNIGLTVDNYLSNVVNNIFKGIF